MEFRVGFSYGPSSVRVPTHGQGIYCRRRPQHHVHYIIKPNTRIKFNSDLIFDKQMDLSHR
jgi:hypothetical protein